ncbi:hypothetical protein [Streptomyces sp. NPDC051684]|uniref:zinc finger domain-containing protein n=1 Tax=Streptomyces sp. NPDC051684 TaxID=3365670 RepID=UPI0037A0EC8E
MNLRETGLLLAASAVISGVRDDSDDKAKELCAKLWHRILADVPYAVAVECLREHYRTNRFPVTPAEIVGCCGNRRRANLSGAPEPAPDADPDNPETYLARLRAQRVEAAATGQWPTADRPSLDSAPGTGSTGNPPYVPDDARQLIQAAITWQQNPCIAVACPAPQCGAQPGEYCQGRGSRSQRGKKKRRCHPSRQEAYEAQFPEESS